MRTGDECIVCKRTSVSGLDGLSVRQCDRCDEYVCENHAEVDYSLEGDPMEYRCSQWVCTAGCEVAA